jgi:hypothetical protein
MKGRTLALFLLVYVTLDLTNPFMPGAVTFVDGRLEVIDASRPAGIDLPVQVGAGVARPAGGEPALARPSARPATAAERSRRWRIPARRGFSIAPEPDLSSDDH